LRPAQFGTPKEPQKSLGLCFGRSLFFPADPTWDKFVHCTDDLKSGSGQLAIQRFYCPVYVVNQALSLKSPIR